MAAEPVLALAQSNTLQLTLYGQPGTAYYILSNSSLVPGPWATQSTLLVTNRVMMVTLPNLPTPATFYRVLRP